MAMVNVSQGDLLHDNVSGGVASSQRRNVVFLSCSFDFGASGLLSSIQEKESTKITWSQKVAGWIKD